MTATIAPPFDDMLYGEIDPMIAAHVDPIPAPAFGDRTASEAYAARTMTDTPAGARVILALGLPGARGIDALQIVPTILVSAPYDAYAITTMCATVAAEYTRLIGIVRRHTGVELLRPSAASIRAAVARYLNDNED